MSLSHRFRIPALLACLGVLSSLGCGGGLDLANSSLPTPSLSLDLAPDACASVGAGQIVFGLSDVRLVENFPAGIPRNRVEIQGTVTGLAPGDSLAVLLLPVGADCPVLAAADAVLDGEAFTAVADLGERLQVRTVLVAHAGTLGDIGCDEAADCLTTAAGGFSAVSTSVEIRLQ